MTTRAIQPAIAPAAWRDEGGGKVKTGNDTPRTGKPIIDRPFPADTITLFCLGGLTWPQGRERFRELGITPETFEDDEARALAAMLLADREPTAHDLGILERNDGERVPWILALECHHPTDPAWAVYLVNLFADAYARHWLPPYLCWAAERIRAGEWTPAHADAELTPLFTLASSQGRAA